VNFFNDDVVHVLQNNNKLAYKFRHRSTLYIANGSQASQQREQR